ncbi:MAG: repair protein RecO [Bacteroidota bacterium]|jgi:DNA repair protein RecO (recombination protein O)
MSTPHHTRGLIIRTIKYGETSLVVSIFTELFGLQQYMVKGIRTSKKSASFSASQFQVGNILDLVVYHHDKNTLQHIKECKQPFYFDHLFADVTKNAVLLFMIELLQKCIKEPESAPELYEFIEDVILGLDKATPAQTANLPLFFILHLSHFFGFRLMDNYSERENILDLREGQFVEQIPIHQMGITYPKSEYIAQMLRVMQIEELDQIQLNKQLRNELLDACLQFYELHISPFGQMKSLPVIRTLLEA